MRKRTEAREAAHKILYAWEITKEPVGECLKKFWEHIEEQDEVVMEYAEFLVAGVQTNLEEIDKVITAHATNWKLDRMATIDRNVLRISSFELLFVDDMPPKVAINEGIELAKKYGDKDSGKFVNGILDKINKTEKVKSEDT